MAISVDSVYKTVLLILNKEQRGYLTPEEFNKIGSQVQREIFERYFDDLNQQLRVPQPDVNYADRILTLDEKIEPFKKEDQAARVVGPPVHYTLPADFYKLGSVTFQPLQPDGVLPTSNFQLSTEMQRVDRTDFYHFRKSPTITPSEKYPIYLYESNKLYVYPESINIKTGIVPAPYGQVNVQYIKKPEDINWGYTIGSVGQFVYASGTSTDFELNNSERVNVILNILMYTGVVIRDPQIVQAAVGQIQQEIVNSKQ